MQLISHKNNTLTICQRLFIEKSLELLYLGSIDSYRVRLNNPKSALEELRYCLEEFQKGRIRHFHTIKAKEKDKLALIDESLGFLNWEPNYLTFTSISQKYLKQLLEKADENNYKRIISAIDLVLLDNTNYLNTIIDGIASLVAANDTTLPELEKIDLALNILLSELVRKGFSKGFLFKLMFGIFVNTLTQGHNFNDHFEAFKMRVLSPDIIWDVIFRIDTTQKVYDSISLLQSPLIVLSDGINDVQLLGGKKTGELQNFNVITEGRKFLRCKIGATDYLAALKKARTIVAEHLDVINLGLSDEFLQIHQRVLVIDSRNPSSGDFQNNVNILDGKYRVEKDHYLEFTRKLPSILNNANIQAETKEKIRSAIRYLRLGNQSTEVEHKFLNYWIGLEYIFSNYESLSTINRIKEHFINAHALAYVKRNTYSFKKDISQIPAAKLALVPSYTTADFSCLGMETFYTEAGQQLLNEFPLLAYRALKLQKWFYRPNKSPDATDYLKKHKTNLEINFTRIYRLRNEIVHDAVTNTNSEHIVSNLRYYLTFILNELIDFFSRTTNKPIGIEDYFVMNEIEIGNIENLGYLLKDLLNVDCSIDFISG